MIKRSYDDGCVGFKLTQQESKPNNIGKYLNDVSPLNMTDTEILVNNIIMAEQSSKVFPSSGYRVAWKRSPDFGYVAIVFCPLQEIYEDESGQ